MENLKIVIVKENGTVRLLEGEGTINKNTLALRNRLTSQDIEYYELDYQERVGCTLNGYIAALNMYPELLQKSKMIKSII